MNSLTEATTTNNPAMQLKNFNAESAMVSLLDESADIKSTTPGIADDTIMAKRFLLPGSIGMKISEGVVSVVGTVEFMKLKL